VSNPLPGCEAIASLLNGQTKALNLEDQVALGPMDEELTVLLVDDSPDDRYFFRRAISRAGLRTTLFEAEDGEEAIDYLTQQGRFSDSAAFPRPDVIFLDLNMPGRNGFDMLRWLQTQPYRNELRVVVISGSNEPHDRTLAAELGANGYLVKPATTQKIEQELTGS
jgi:CheY-like chemotaxis protein